MAGQIQFLLGVLFVSLVLDIVECNRTSKKIINRIVKAERLLCEKIDNVTELIKELNSPPKKPCPVPGTCVPGCLSGEVCIDLDKTGKIEGVIPGFSVVSPQTPLVDRKPCSRQAVFKVHFQKDAVAPESDICFDKKAFLAQRMLKIQMYFSNGERDGWMFDVGDSKSNDGWAGDAGDQDFSAEVQGLGKNIHVYANTRQPTVNHNCTAQNLFGFGNATDYPVSIVNHWVANHYWKTSNDNGLVFGQCNPCLFGLQGQNDVRGPENEDIFIAANRVIHTNSRNGVGLCFMKMRWVSGPNQ